MQNALMTRQHERLASELVRALRGRRSQQAFGRRLGFSSNVLYAWESGRRFPAASAFFRIAARAGIDVASALRGFLDETADTLSSARLGTPVGVADLLHVLAGKQSVASLARTLGRDRTTVTRWLQGRTEPRLPDLLVFIEATTLRLLDVVARFVDPAELPSTGAAYRSLTAQRRLAYELPWSHAILRALELVTPDGHPRNDTAAVATSVGLPQGEVRDLLDALAEAGQVQRHGDRWSLATVLTVDTRADEEQNLRLKRHWAEVALARLERTRGAGSSLFSYNLFAISRSNYEVIRHLHLEYYDRMREVVANDRNPERVVVANLQLCALDE